MKPRLLLRILLPTATLALASAAALASPVTYIIEVNGTGTFNGSDFVGQNVTFTAVGDTDDIVSGGMGILNIPTAATVSLPGLGSDSFTDSMGVFVNNPSGVAGFGRYQNADLADIVNDSFNTYDLRTSVGPLEGLASTNLDLGFATSGGSFSFSSIRSGTFTARAEPVPEPATLAALGLGAAALLRRRKRG